MPDLPLHYTRSLLTRQPGAGIPGGPTVFQSLATPPASGVNAETAAINRAKSIGVVKPNSAALSDSTRQRDRIRDFYDSASILRV